MLDSHCDFELEKVITQEWDARLTWNERDVSRLNVGSMFVTFNSPLTLNLNFQRQILKLLYLRNGRGNQHTGDTDDVGCSRRHQS